MHCVNGNEIYQSALLENSDLKSDYGTAKYYLPESSGGRMSPKTQDEWQQLDKIFGAGVSRRSSKSTICNGRNIPNYYTTLQTTKENKSAMFSSSGYNCIGQKVDYQMDSPYNEHKLYFTVKP